MRRYELALGNKVDALIKEVERFAAFGYVPQGGIAVSEAYGRLGQAMVLPDSAIATVTLFPTAVTVPNRGGSGSVNATLTGPGTWEVDPASIPSWLTITPAGLQTADVQIVYTGAANTTGTARQAVVKVNTATLTFSQS